METGNEIFLVIENTFLFKENDTIYFLTQTYLSYIANPSQR